MSSPLSVSLNRRLGVAGLMSCCALLLSSGCGPDYKGRGVVKGKITVGNRPLPSGTVTFHGKDGGMTGTATVDEEGNYEIKDAPLGECRITVTVPDRALLMKDRGGKGPKMPEGPKDPNSSSPGLPSGAKLPKAIIPIDPRYENPDTSGLKFTVQKGEQTHNIEL